MNKEINKELSIIIPAKNEEKTISILFDSILNQDYPFISETPVYFADANSTDKTREIVLSYADRLPVTIVKGGLPAIGRNAGAKEAKSDYVLFIDADMDLADRGIIRKTVETMKNKNLHCVTTNIRYYSGDFWDKFLNELNNICQRLSRFVGTPYATGMYMAFNREIFNKLGGFNERVEFAEDFYLSRNVKWNRFGIIPGYVLTSNRRFKKMGHWKMVKLFLKSLLRSRDDSYFLNHNAGDYWK
jgi:glycosyltransferase involved in cell wall biosynthesis